MPLYTITRVDGSVEKIACKPERIADQIQVGDTCDPAPPEEPEE